MEVNKERKICIEVDYTRMEGIKTKRSFIQPRSQGTRVGTVYICLQKRFDTKGVQFSPNELSEKFCKKFPSSFPYSNATKFEKSVLFTPTILLPSHDPARPTFICSKCSPETDAFLLTSARKHYVLA